jgi:FkbM family methyltransferase
MLQRLGSDYGGWYIDLDLIPEGSTILSAGVGEDISFDIELINRKNCQIIGIDPTEKSEAFVKRCPIRNFTFLNKALWYNQQPVKIYRNKKASEVSDSVSKTNRGVSPDLFYWAETVTIPELLQQYPNVSVLKIDIEGAEYEVLQHLTSLLVPQVCVEFHHRYLTEYTEQDTQECMQRMLTLGYQILHSEEHGTLFARK